MSVRVRLGAQSTSIAGVMTKPQNRKHPSWGLIALSHQTGKCRLFQSPALVHSQVSIRVSRASMTAPTEHSGRSHPFPEEEFIEVRLSPVQFAELISQPNRGNGVPCTIHHVNGEYVESPPVEDDDIQDVAGQAGSRGVGESIKVLDGLIASVEARILEGKGLSPSGLRELAQDLKTARMRSTTDLGYWREEINRRAESMRAKLATDLHATADLIIRNMGLGALAEKARTMLPDFGGLNRIIEVDEDQAP